MHQKKWIISGLIALATIFCLVILTSSSSSDKLAPINTTTCSKTLLKECNIPDNDQGIIQERMSRQFL